LRRFCSLNAVELAAISEKISVENIRKPTQPRRTKNVDMSDDLKQWEDALRDTCGQCGMPSLTQELRVCPLCGATKPTDWAERNRTYPLAPGEAFPIDETARAAEKGRPDLATKWLDEVARSSPRPRR
jgi:hypothetical protein